MQFGINHLPLTTTSGQAGYHTLINFASTVSNPNLSAPQSSLYPKLLAGVAELFFQNNTTSNSARQLTNLTINTVANGGTAGGNIYYIDTPWNIRFYSGQTATIPGSGSRTVVFPSALDKAVAAS